MDKICRRLAHEQGFRLQDAVPKGNAGFFTADNIREAYTVYVERLQNADTEAYNALGQEVARRYQFEEHFIQADVAFILCWSTSKAQRQIDVWKTNGCK